jgi:hypothetical protein
MISPTRAILTFALMLALMFATLACAGGQPAAPSQPPADEPPATDVEPSEPPELTNEQVPVPAEAACGGKACTPPEQCIRYAGVAGPSIPLYTCGVPCGEQGECPTGMSCATIADGPRLCR